MNDIDKIELRSEKVRKIIGDMPSGFIRYGIGIITCIIILLFVICYFTPYKNGQNIIEYSMNVTGGNPPVY